MRRQFLFLGLAVLLAGCGAPGKRGPQWSAPPVPARDENFRGGPNAILLKYDANHDGSVSRAELEQGLKAEFKTYDTAGKGCLDVAQVAAINAKRISLDKSTATPLQDWNQDGCVDLREFSTAATSLFDQLDKNGDGVVSPREFGTKRPGSKPAAASHDRQGHGRRGSPPPNP